MLNKPNICIFILSLGDKGFQIESSMIGFPNSPNLSANISPIQSPTTKLHRRSQFRSILNLFSIQFDHF